uniref:Uncharacterized protein n=1 Tax=Romanomermis culicivorax TaxID=13658 RepID=A0A915J0Y2_ROMCU
GVQFVTTPILISDILCQRIPISLVTGLLVYRAHTVLRSALESFILLTFRKEKPDIFVKAFSDAPQRFVEHLGQLQRAVSSLRVDRVYFLPRYHAEVISELDSAEKDAKPDLVEIAVKLTPCMKNAQNYLIELLRACLQELKRTQQRANVTDSDSDLTLEAVLQPWFEDNYRRKIESRNASFDQVPLKFKRLLNDISRLKQFLSSLEIDDGKSFAKNVDILR